MGLMQRALRKEPVAFLGMLTAPDGLLTEVVELSNRQLCLVQVKAEAIQHLRGMSLLVGQTLNLEAASGPTILEAS